MTSPTPTPTQPQTTQPLQTAQVPGKLVTVLTWVKFLLPVAAGLSSIWLHNQTTASKINTTLGAVENTLGSGGV